MAIAAATTARPRTTSRPQVMAKPLPVDEAAAILVSTAATAHPPQARARVNPAQEAAAASRAQMTMAKFFLTVVTAAAGVTLGLTAVQAILMRTLLTAVAAIVQKSVRLRFEAPADDLRYPIAESRQRTMFTD